MKNSVITSRLREKAAARPPVTAEKRGGPPHLVITARAGTGKTTTLVGGLQVLRGMTPTGAKGQPLTPSPQQQAIWEAMSQSKDARTVAFCAFNKSIATELQARVPPGAVAMTMHSLGNKAVSKAFGYCRLDNNRVAKIIEEILEQPIEEIRRSRFTVLKATEDLVRMVKMNLVPTDVIDPGDQDHVDQLLQDLVDYYDIDFEPEDDGGRGRYQRRRPAAVSVDAECVKRQVFDLVPQVIARCKEVAKDRTIDFNDMVWLPVALGLTVERYDLLLVDEAQDLNRCQQALAKMSGRRLVFCGDDKQAIYGFAGADCESLPRLTEELGRTPRGVVTLPLTQTRRCAKAVVREAQKYVQDFGFFDTNPEGLVATLPFSGPWYDQVRDGDFLLCRVNAPLVSAFFRFISTGRRASILGRDLGTGLIRFVRKLKAGSVPDLLAKADRWLEAEEKAEMVRKFPREDRLASLQDKVACLAVFCQGAASVQDVVVAMEQAFTDDRDRPGIRLSSVHKAKGLEARRVFIMMPKGASIPHPMARTPWAREQENNILYVGITRSIEELYYVRDNA
jgi:DNA helicase II / ATP-dependent DNA helicase PcrA